MDLEYHYWITSVIAKRSGFSREETETIGYASQYVDKNDICLEIRDKAHPNRKYNNFISQTMNILKPKDKLMRIYPIFHFVPGEPDALTARRRDGKMHLLNTTPNSPNANTLIDAAFKADTDTRLYRIGIASHVYVDSWAHQNFVGWYDNFNDMGFDPKPNIGHADAEHHPDWVSHRWVDCRLVEQDLNNLHRFLSASEELFLKYCGYLKSQGKEDRSNQWPQFEEDLVKLMGPTYTGNKNKFKEARLGGYQNTWGGDFPEFNELTWFDEAIRTKVRGRKDSTVGLRHLITIFKDEYYWKDGVDKEKTHWYRFQEAVKEHERLGLEVLSPTFQKMGFDLAVN